MATYEELLDYANKYNPQPNQLGVSSFNQGEMIQQEETPYQRMMRETYGNPAQMQGQTGQQGAEEPTFTGSLFRGAMAQGIGTLGGQADFAAGLTNSETLRNLGDTAQKTMQEYSRPHEYTANEIFGSGLSGLWKYISDPNGAAYDIGGGLGSTAAMAAEAALLSAALPSSVAAAGTGAVAAFAARLGLKSVAGALKGGGTAAKLIKNVIASTPLEAASESGGTYREMTTDEQGNRLDADKIDMDKVQEAMAKNFVGNLGVLGASNLLESVGIGRLFGDKMRQGILGKVRDIGAFMATNAGQNAWEEGAQTGTNLYAQGKIDNISQIVNPYDWNEEQWNAAAIGGVAGLGQGTLMGGAGHVLNKMAGPQQQQDGNPAVNIQNKVTNDEFADAVAIAKHDTSTNLVDRMRNLEGRIAYNASDGTNCARTIGLALAGTDYQDLINVDNFVAVAKEKGQLKDPNSYVPKPGDLAVVNNGNHIVMVSENGGTIQNGSSRDGVYESAQSPLQMFGAVKYYISTSDLSSGEYGVSGNLQGQNEEQRQQEYYQNLIAQERQRRADAIREVMGEKTHEQEQQEQAMSEAQKYQQENASEIAPVNEYYDAFTDQELNALNPQEKQTLKDNFDAFYGDKRNWSHTAAEKVQVARGMYNQLVGNRQQTTQTTAAPAAINNAVTKAAPKVETPVEKKTEVPANPNATETKTGTTVNTAEKVEPTAEKKEEQPSVPANMLDIARRGLVYGDSDALDAFYKMPPEMQANAQKLLDAEVEQEQNRLDTSGIPMPPEKGNMSDEEYDKVLEKYKKDLAQKRQEAFSNARVAPTDEELANVNSARPVNMEQGVMAKQAEEQKAIDENVAKGNRVRFQGMLNDLYKKRKNGQTEEDKQLIASQVNAASKTGLAMLDKGATAEEAFNAVKDGIGTEKQKAKAKAEIEKQARKETKKNGKTETTAQPTTGENRDTNPNTEPEKVEPKQGKSGQNAAEQNENKVTEGVKENGSNESRVSAVPEGEQSATVPEDAGRRETGAVPGPANGTSEKVQPANDEAVRNGTPEPRPARSRRLSGKSENVGGKTNEQTTLWGRLSGTLRAFANTIRQLCADHEDDRIALDDLREQVDDELDKIDKEIAKAEKPTAQQDYDNYFKYIKIYVGGKEYHAELFTGPKGQEAIRWVTPAGSLADRGSKRSLGILMWHTLVSRDESGNYPSLSKVISSIENYYKKNKNEQIPQSYQEALEYGKKLKKQKQEIVVADDRTDNTTKYSAAEKETSTVEEASNTEKGKELKRSLDDLIAEAKRAFKGATKFRINRDDLIFTMPNGVEIKVNIKDQIMLSAEDEAKARKEHGLSDDERVIVEGYAKVLDKGSLVVLSKEGQRGTSFHEAFHTVWNWVLNEKEKAAMLKHFTPIAKEKGIDVEEAMADGYRDWLLARQQHKGTIFGKLYQKVLDFANAALRVLTGAENVHNIYQQIEEGKVWNRDAKGRFATEENAVNNDKKFLVTNKKITADTQVPVVDVTNSPKFNMTGPEIKKAVLELINDKEGNPIRFTIQGEGPIGRVANIDMGKHIFRSSDKHKTNINSSARKRVLSKVQELFESAIYVEKHPDVKGSATRWVELYGVVGNNNDKTMTRFRVVAKEGNPKSGQFEVSDVKFYDIIKDGIVSANPSQNGGNTVTSMPSSISIAQLLDGVKDRNGKLYVTNGKLNYEPGVLGSGTKYSVRLASGKEVTSADLPTDFSTSKPGGEKAITDPQMELTFADYESAQKDKTFFDNVIEKTRKVVGLDVPAKDSKEAAEQMIERMVANIRFLLNKVPEEYRDRAKRWYEGGNKIATTWAERYGIPKQATAGVMAVLSPQMDWFTNVTLAERVLDAVYGHANERWSKKMTAIAKKIVSKDNSEAKVNLPALERAKGKTLKELIANGDYRAAAIWVRCYDQVNNDRGYKILTPEGGVGDYVKTDKDENATAAWGNYGPIEKAISIAANPSYANIFYQLGDKHKVRNFANNLNNPDSEFFTTVDTHAVGVGLMQPVSSTKSNSVLQNFGTGSSSSKAVGMSGSYFLYYEAIRRVAEETGLKPREVQSITWEAIRSLFPPHMKFGSEEQKKILELWRQGDKEIKNLKDPNDKKKVEEILDRIRNQVYDIGTEQTGVLRQFDWANTPFDATTADTYKRSNVKIQKFDKRENGKGGSSFGIEAAPDPKNKKLTDLWEKVKKQNPQLAQQISDEVVENTIRKVFREFGLDFSPHTDLVPRLGGYLGKTNPSYELVIENPNLLLPMSKMLGKALNQESVMLVSSQEALGTTPHDIISISLPDGWGEAEIDEFYKKLYEIKGPKDKEGNPRDLFTGHSTSDGVMTIVNTDKFPVELLLNGIKSIAPNIAVEVSDGYCGFVSQDEYGFANENEKEPKPEEVVRVQIPKEWSKKQTNALAKKIGGLKNKKGVALASSTSTAKGLMTIERTDGVGVKSLLDAIKAIAPDLTVTKENKDAGLNTEFVPKKIDDRRANLIQREATEELERKLLAATGSDLQADGTGLDERKGRGDEGRNLKNDGGVRREISGKEGNQAGRVTTEQTNESTQGDEGASSMPKKYSITSAAGKALDKAEAYVNRNVRTPNENTATGRAAKAFNNTQNKNKAQTWTEWLKDRFDKFYREWIDKNDAIHNVDDAIEQITGKKLAEEDKIYNMVQGARAYAQGAADTLVQGTKEAFESLKDSLGRGIDPKDTAAMKRLAELKKDFNFATVQQALEPIMKKDMDEKYPDYLEKNGINNWHDAFSNYLGARRVLELVRLVEDKSLAYITHDKKEFTDFIDRHPEYEKFRPKPFAKGTWRDQVQNMAKADPVMAEKLAKDLAKEYKMPKGVSRADLEAMVKEAPKEFDTAAQHYYQLQRNLLTMMELGHLIPAEVHDKINKMYKDYCPLMIDYSDTAGLDTAIAQFGRGADSIANVDSMLKHVLQLGSERGLISPLESTYKSIQTLTNRAERNKVAVHFIKTVANSEELRKSGILKEVPGSSPDAKNCIFTALINGKKVAFQTTQDLYGPIVGYDMPAAGIVEGMCRTAAQTLRYGATTSPSFIIRNVIRDTIFAGVSSRNGFIPIIDSAKGMWAYTHDKELRGEFDAMGITAYNYFGSGKNAVKSMEELMGEKDWAYLKAHPTELIKELIKYIPKKFEHWSEVAEASTRMGEYMRARKAGKSMQEAALDARDVTLDFSRSGFYGQRVNMMVPFFNACIQGGDKMFNRMLFSKDPKVREQTMRMLGLYIMLPSIALWFMHKDEPWYEELDPHIKMNNWIIGKLRIPKPQEAGIAFGSGIEAILDKIYNKDPKAGKEWVNAMREVLVPNLIPTVGLPMLEWVTNYSLFRDKPIEGNRLKRLPVEMRYNTNTTEISKALGKAAGLSPVKLDNTIRGYTGTLGMLAAQIPDFFFEDKQNLPSKPITERALVRDFFLNDMNMNRTSEDFYNLVNAAQQQHAGYGKKGKPTQDVKMVNKALRDVSKQQKDIQTITDARNISPDRKRQLIDKKRDVIRTIQKKTLERYRNKFGI
jgi:hypothetical protein